MSETEPNETPRIELAHKELPGTNHVAFWIVEQRGKWDAVFVHNGIQISAPCDNPVWLSGCNLYPRGADSDNDLRPMLATREEWPKITELVAAFNAHYAKPAKEPRRILDVITLGRETTARECVDCHGLDPIGLECKKYGAVIKNFWLARQAFCRHADCCAAEERYKAMRAMMGAE